VKQQDIDEDYYRANKQKMMKPSKVAEKIAEMIFENQYVNGQSVDIG
jgi:hypothetical protein